MKNEFQTYINSQVHFREKWNEYKCLKPNFSLAHFREELTPLNGTKFFDQLSKEEKERFFLEYIKLVAESLVFFEQLLMLGVWGIEKKGYKISMNTKQALKQFAYDELYHSEGFRNFLSIHKIFNWDKNKVFADAWFLRKIISKIVVFAPASVFLPGAKLEAFTLSYYKMIKKYYPDNKSNAWIHLNYIHAVDEALHLPLEFDLHNSIIEETSPVKTILGGFLFVMAMQFALIVGSYRVVKYSFPHSHIFKRLKLMLKMARWAVRTTPAYKEARVMTRNHFKNKKPKYGKFMSFIYW